MPDFKPPSNRDTTPSDHLGPARPLLITSSRLGFVALERGDERGAHEIFACAARAVCIGNLAATPILKKLQASLDAADLEPEPKDRAQTLHETITDVLGEVIEDADDDEGDPLERIQGMIAAAISVGAFAYNVGLHRGCYEVYAATARLAALRWPESENAQHRLADALRKANATTDETRRAWLLREAFDEVLAMESNTKKSTISKHEMRLLISMAIQIGAPAYNLGDRRGCYEIYAATARLLIRVGPKDDHVVDALKAVLQKVILEPDVTEQAWLIRRTFDAILSTTDDVHE